MAPGFSRVMLQSKHWNLEDTGRVPSVFWGKNYFQSKILHSGKWSITFDDRRKKSSDRQVSSNWSNWKEASFLEKYWECVLIKQVVNSSKKKIRNPTFGHLSKGNEISVLRRYLCSHVHCTIIHNSQSMETIKMSIDGWMDKENVAYKCNGILFNFKKEGDPGHLQQHGWSLKTLC